MVFVWLSTFAESFNRLYNFRALGSRMFFSGLMRLD